MQFPFSVYSVSSVVKFAVRMVENLYVAVWISLGGSCIHFATP